MEKRIKEYEEFIKKRLKNPDKGLLDYHREVLANFQHERMVHLVIMVFFIILTLGMTVVCLIAMYGIKIYHWWDFLPLALATFVMWILSIFYVKHYYFLENHVQGLYDISKELYENYENAKKDTLMAAGVELGQKIVKKVEKIIKKEK